MRDGDIKLINEIVNNYKKNRIQIIIASRKYIVIYFKTLMANGQKVLNM